MATERKQKPAGSSRRRKSPQLQLPLGAKEAGNPEVAEGGGLYFLTNRMNMLAALSSGLIRPREGLEKYYDDLCNLVPGRLPLWGGSIPSNIYGECSSDRFFPVVFEIDAACLVGDGIQGIGRDLEVARYGLPDFDAHCLCILPSAVIPLAYARRIHLRSEGDRTDMLSRTFENIDLEALPIRISPDLFEGEPIAWEKFRLVLASLDTPKGLALPALYRRVDSYAGALAMMAVAMPSLPAWPKQLMELLKAGRRDGKVEPSGGVPWMKNLRELLVSGEARDSCGDFASDLFLASARLAAGACPLDGLDPAEFVGQIAEMMRSKENGNHQEQIERFETRVRKIVANEVDNISFDDDPSEERIVQRAVTFFLMRVKPDRILSALEKPNPPGETVWAVAALLAGIYYGAERLPLSVRSRIVPWRRLLVLLADHCNREGSSDISFVADAVPTVDLTVCEEENAHRRIAVEIDGEDMAVFHLHPSNSMMKVFHLAKEAGISLHYSFDEDCFLFNPESPDGDSRTIRICKGASFEPSGTQRRLGTIRFTLGCTNLLDEQLPNLPARLLQLNAELPLAKFAMDIDGTTLLAISDQIVDTVDREELLAHIHAVEEAARRLGRLGK